MYRHNYIVPTAPTRLYGPNVPPPGGGATANPLHSSWRDPNVNANALNARNVLAYFCDQRNPFYDHRGSLNAYAQMQRTTVEAVAAQGTVGLEYQLIHVQEPLFLIKAIRHMPPQPPSTVACYYIIAGIVYQAPDLASIVNSRVANAVHLIREAFKISLVDNIEYDPAKGFQFQGSVKPIKTLVLYKESEEKKDPPSATETTKQSNEQSEQQEEDVKSTLFQRTYVEHFLNDLTTRFPLTAAVKQEAKVEGPANEPTASQQTKQSMNGQAVHSMATSTDGAPPRKKIKAEIS